MTTPSTEEFTNVYPIDSRILHAATSGNLIVVLGSGATASYAPTSAGTSWLDLLLNGLAYLETLPGKTTSVEYILQTLQETNPDYVTAATLLKRDLKENFGPWIVDTFTSVPPIDSELPQALARLSAPIFTTNYDTYLESVLGWDSTSYTQPDEMLRVLRGESPHVVGHLHGIYNDPESIIFSNSDYAQIANNRPAQSFQNSAFATKSFLFVGMGAGTADPNFKKMSEYFGKAFTATLGHHFRLDIARNCRLNTNDTIVDIPYGDKYEDLAEYINAIAMRTNPEVASLSTHAQTALVQAVSDLSLAQLDPNKESSVDPFHDVIAPTLRSKSHSEIVQEIFATPTLHPATPLNVEIEEFLTNLSRVNLVVGEPESGVSTAIQYLLHRTSDVNSSRFPILLDDIRTGPSAPIAAALRRGYGVESLSAEPYSALDIVLGIDQIDTLGQPTLKRLCQELADLGHVSTIIGLHYEALQVVETYLKSSGLEYQIVHLGHLGESQALAFARMTTSENPERLSRQVMSVVRDRNLPRTAQTMFLLTELLASSVDVRSNLSEVSLLKMYVEHLLAVDLPKLKVESELDVHQKMRVLGDLGVLFVQNSGDALGKAEVLSCIRQTFESLSWQESDKATLTDFVNRGLLVEFYEHDELLVRFSRRALLAVAAADRMVATRPRSTSPLYSLVSDNPVKYYELVQSYAALAHDDLDMLQKVCNLAFDSVSNTSSISEDKNSVFLALRVESASITADHPEPDQAAEGPASSLRNESPSHDESASKKGSQDVYFSTPRDIDLADRGDEGRFIAPIEDYSAAQVSTITTALASRILRDSDMIQDPQAKNRSLGSLVDVWISLGPEIEKEFSSPEFLEVVESIPYDKDSSDNSSASTITAEQREARNVSVVRTIVAIVLAEGMKTNLPNRTTFEAIESLQHFESRYPKASSLVSAYLSSLTATKWWTRTLAQVHEDAIASPFGMLALLPNAFGRYLEDESLDGNQLADLENYFRRVIVRMNALRPTATHSVPVDKMLSQMRARRERSQHERRASRR